MALSELSLYIHIPFCLSKCNYCDFFSLPLACNHAVPDDYISALCNEIDFRFKDYGPALIKTVYIGGGTPSLLNKEQINKICRTIKNLGLASDYEFTFEVNPDDLSTELLLNLDACGVNRLSCGIQSFSDRVLKKAGRRADRKTVYKALELIEKYWNKKLSVDLICGLPGESQDSMQEGLDYLVNKNISHISFYSLCVEEETPLGRAILEGSQKYDEDFTDRLWLKGRDYLIQEGYQQYEISNFAKPQNECLHNMTYWTHKDYIGCGSGATGTLYNSDIKGQGFRYTNIKDPQKYSEFWNQNPAEISQNAGKIPQDVEKIIQKTSKFEYFMMGLRTKRGIFPGEYEETFGQKISAPVLKKLESACKKSEEGSFYLEKDRLIFLNGFLQDLLDVID